MSYFESSREQVQQLASRFRLMQVIIFCLLAGLAARLWYLQIYSGNKLRKFSEQNLLKEVNIPAPRGNIFDRNNKLLVENLPSFEATITPQYVEDLDQLSTVLSEVVQISAQEIKSKVKIGKKLNGSFKPVSIKKNISRNQVFELELIKIDFPGLNVEENIQRSYIAGESAAPPLGYIGEISKEQMESLSKKKKANIYYKKGDLIGKSGLEKVFDDELRGVDGVSFIKVDAKGRETSEDLEIFGSIAQKRNFIKGSDIYLTIDYDLQKAGYKAFLDRELTGALVAMKPNGEVLSMISAPSFDPTELSTRITTERWKELINDKFTPLRNKTIQDHNSPGSIFKPIVAIAALQELIISENTLVMAPGQFKLGNRIYHDHSRDGQGNINVKQALEMSSNVFFYKQGLELGVDKIQTYAKGLGLGEKTQISLRNEARGFIPSSAWKKKKFGEAWQKGEDLNTAIGQGFILVTPLQMASSYATIANEGKQYLPFLVKKIVDGDKTIVRNSKLLQDLSSPDNKPYISKENFQIVKKGLFEVVQGKKGTGRRIKNFDYTISGKTGTSQVRSFSAKQIYSKCHLRDFKDRHHAWFVGYAPAESPEIIVAVFAEHACAGSRGAAPIAKDIFDAYYNKYLKPKEES